MALAIHYESKLIDYTHIPLDILNEAFRGEILRHVTSTRDYNKVLTIKESITKLDIAKLSYYGNAKSMEIRTLVVSGVYLCFYKHPDPKFMRKLNLKSFTL